MYLAVSKIPDTLQEIDDTQAVSVFQKITVCIYGSKMPGLELLALPGIKEF